MGESSGHQGKPLGNMQMMAARSWVSTGMVGVQGPDLPATDSEQYIGSLGVSGGSFKAPEHDKGVDDWAITSPLAYR